jgi:phage terminase large subunit-like protein
MWGLVLENGRRWGEVAVQQQIEDIEAIFDDARPHRHFITRPRGGSKTTDLAGVALSWLCVEAPPRARGYVVAANGEQAAILIDAAASLVSRTPELEDALVLENERILAPNGAWVRVLNLSDTGAWGLRDVHLLILDEFAQWPETRGAKRVYTAVRSTVQKVESCRLVILTSAGEPEHWSYREVFEPAKSDPTWRVSEMPGPVPWHDPEEIAALRRELRPSEFDRLVRNIWTQDEERAITEEDWELAAQPYRAHLPRPGVRYLITVDIGLKHDATVCVVAHKEPVDPANPHGPQRVIVDRLERWKGTRRKPVQLKSVEDWLVETAHAYNRARVYGDPDQFQGSLQNLNRRGVRASEWTFTSSSVGQVATALVQCFRNRLIFVPDEPTLRDELLRVRLRETAPGVVRLDHDRSGHDDQAVAIGMACHLLLSSGASRSVEIFKEFLSEQTTKRKQRSDEVSRAVAAVMQRPERLARARERMQRRCEHRWRDGRCVFGCGATASSA